MNQPSDTEIHRIIDAGQATRAVVSPARPVLLLTILSQLMLWACFSPLQWAPLGWIALTPLCLLLHGPALTRRQSVLVLLCGWLQCLVTLQWMRLGDPSMYVALFALSFYCGLYYPVFLNLSRRLIVSGIPVWCAAPLVWTALDFVRAWLMSGFSWYYLAHSQYRWTELVQISDITGTYGVTFLLAMSSAVIAEYLAPGLLPRLGLPRLTESTPRRTLSATVLLLLLTAAAIIYGSQRQQPTDVTDGPVVALIQGHFPPEAKHAASRQALSRMIYEHELLSRRAAQEQPDIMIWPETMWPEALWEDEDGTDDSRLVAAMIQDGLAPPQMSPSDVELRRERGRHSQQALVNRSQEFGVSLIIGLTTLHASSSGLKIHNSAALFRPDLGAQGRYHKRHLVPFAEKMPLKDSLPILKKLLPYAGLGNQSPGQHPQIFESGQTRYAPIICFEDTVPRVVRSAVRATDASGAHPDVLVNLTNDCWFRGSSELDQHLITSTFRCIETRRPMVRSVNGGISAIIDSSGRIRDPEQFLIMKSTKGLSGEFERVESLVDPDTGDWYRQVSGVVLGQVPLDGRDTVYLQYGDWFAMLCSAAALALLIRSRFHKPLSTD